MRNNGVQVIYLAAAERNKMQKAAVKIWDDVDQKDPACAKAVEMIKDFNR